MCVHTSRDGKLTKCRGRQESEGTGNEGTGNEVPKGSVQSLELFILVKQMLGEDESRSQVSKAVTRYRIRERARALESDRLGKPWENYITSLGPEFPWVRGRMLSGFVTLS